MRECLVPEERSLYRVDCSASSVVPPNFKAKSGDMRA
jgi:hypothetical protein